MRKNKLIIKAVATLTAISFAFTYLPAMSGTYDASSVYAATATDSTGSGDTTGGNTTGGAISGGDLSGNDADDSYVYEKPYSIAETGAKPAFTAYSNMEDWKGRESFDAPENTYALQCATGASAGDTVLYFAIKYKDSSGVVRTQYVFPHVDGAARSRALLEHYGDKDKINTTYGSKIAKELGYQEGTVEEAAPLAAWTIQDFIFEAEADISTVLRINVYVERGQWTAQGINLYSVTKYTGYEEYGLISGQKFLDYEGTLIADVKAKNAGSQLYFQTSGSDTVHSVGGTFKTAVLTNYPAGSRTEKKLTDDDSMYSLRVDFADVAGGGLECFLNPKAKTIGESGIYEQMAMELQYKDTNGWTRKVTLPILINSYAMTKRNLKDSITLGFAQRGDTVAFQGYLPGFSSIIGNPIVYAGDSARSQIKDKGGIEIPSSTVSNYLKKWGLISDKYASDDFGLSGVSIYKGGCMPYILDGTDSNGASVKGATVDFVFQNKYPLQYYTITADTGAQVKSGGNISLVFSKYIEGNPIVASGNGENKFLVTLRTSENDLAATNSDVKVMFYYTNNDGTNMKTREYRVLTAASEYLGSWPTESGGNYIEESGFVKKGSISFLVDADDVSEFTGMEVSIDGKDEWVIENMTISFIESYGKRKSYVTPVETGGAKSNFWIDRSAISAEIFNLKTVKATVYDENGNALDSSGTGIREQVFDDQNNPVYDEAGNPVYVQKVSDNSSFSRQLLQGDRSYTFVFDSKSIVDIREKDWSSVRYSMTHDETGVNWGFFKTRKSYDVAVDVAADSDYDTGNGDSGSKNHFYFQLLFKNGNSAYVLANQQLTGDGFRSNHIETFTISTNRDYGELTGIHIIPEDVDDSSDPFDKLNIAKVTVSEQTNGGSYLSYIVDNVGWIEIDYVDSGEQGSTRGQRSRLENQLTKDYPVAYKERSVKLLCEISCMPYVGEYDPMIASVTANVHYIEASTGKIREKSFDVVQQIAKYIDSTAESVETETDPKRQVVAADGLGTISDDRYMFRANHTDRFCFPAISDLKSIVDMEFTVQTKLNKPCYWNIGNISIAQVLEDGQVQLNANDEYYRNMTIRSLCTSTNKETITNFIPALIPTPIEAIEFTKNELVWTSDEWATPVSRIPDSADDTVNVFLYPTSKAENKTNASVDIGFKYFIPFSQYLQTSQKGLTKTTDGRGNTVYYVKGLKVPNFVSASELKIKCVSTTMAFDYAVVEHVRGSTVVDRYSYNFLKSSATLGATAKPTSTDLGTDYKEETLAISFGSGTADQGLVAEGRDVAVAFSYKSTIDDGTQEYMSPYVYLTDQNINSIREGTFAEIKYDVPYVKEITGYSIAGYGELEATVNAAAAQVYSVKPQDKKINETTGQLETLSRSRYSYSAFSGSFAITDKTTRHERTKTTPYETGSVTPVTLTLKTGEVSKSLGDNTKLAVRMIFKYRDALGATSAVRFEDISPYIQEDEPEFKSNSEHTIKLFLPNMSSNLTISSIDVLPYNKSIETGEETESDADVEVVQATDTEVVDAVLSTEDVSDDIINNRDASIVIESLNLDLAFGEKQIPRSDVNQTFLGLENGGTIRLSKITLILNAAKNDEEMTPIKDGLGRFTADSGDVLYVKTLVTNSDGYTVKAYQMIGNTETGEKLPDDSIVFSEKDKQIFQFKVPDNKTGDLVTYRLDIATTEDPDITGTIYVTVKSLPVEIESIAIDTPGKTSYTVGDTLDVSGMTIKATKTDGTTESVVVSEAMVSGFDSTTAGTKTLTITYSGKTTTYSVTVTAAEPDTSTDIDNPGDDAGLTGSGSNTSNTDGGSPETTETSTVTP